jgi:hypothetical protein
VHQCVVVCCKHVCSSSQVLSKTMQSNNDLLQLCTELCKLSSAGCAASVRDDVAHVQEQLSCGIRVSLRNKGDSK